MKKGFTLVELLAVIVIITIIFVIVFPIASNIVIDSQNAVNEVQIDRILDAAYDYTLKNLSFLPENGETSYITLNHLQKEGLVDIDIMDVKNDKLYPADLVISIKNVESNYKKSDNLSKVVGNYLYKIEDDSYTNKPIFKFSSYSTNPIVVNANLGSTYIEPSYTVTSHDGVDLTNKVIKNIVLNSEKVTSVDTYVTGIYYIYYSVVDDEGNSNSATINVIIVDNQLPVLTIPDNISISSSVSSYDLMDGVSCVDNSGECDVDINGSIKFGVTGKYIIEYIAKDPSGNTTTLKRVITVT